MADDSAPGRGGGFASSDNIWILIPLAALSIPILAIVGDTPLVWVLAVVALIGAVTASARYLLQLQHRQRLDEIAARERLAVAERDRYTAVERMLEQEGVPPERPRDGS
jgi:hypothetical protein